jgi:hypothetical protein
LSFRAGESGVVVSAMLDQALSLAWSMLAEEFREVRTGQLWVFEFAVA